MLDHALLLELGGDGAQARALLDDHRDRAADLAVGEVGAGVADPGADHEREQCDQEEADEAAATAPLAALAVTRATAAHDAEVVVRRGDDPGGS